MNETPETSPPSHPLRICERPEAEAVELAVMAAGVIGAGATLAFMLPGLDSFFSW